MTEETPKEGLPQGSSKPIDFSDFKKPLTVSEMKEGQKEKLEGSVTGPCKNESLKNKEGQDEKNLIGLNEQQRDDLGVGLKDYVNVTIEGNPPEVKRYMVVKGLKENIGKDNFTANGIGTGKKITVQK